MGSKLNGSRASFIPTISSASDSGDLEHLTTPQLVSFLKSTFLNSEFEEVSRILTSREQSVKEELVRREAALIKVESRCWDLEDEHAFLKARSIELEQKLKRGDEGFSAKMTELERMLREEKERFTTLEAKCGELEFAKFVAAEEAERYKRNHERLQEQIKCLEEDREVLRERERRAQDRIEGLLEELQRKEREVTETFIGLKVENRDLDCGKRRAQDEVDVWKRKYGELEASCLQRVEEILSLRERLDTMEKQKGETHACGCNRIRVDEDCNTQHRNQLSSNLEMGFERKVSSCMHVSEKPLFEGVIEISDSDSEMDAEAPCLVGRHQGGAPYIKIETVSKKSSKKMDFEQRNFEALSDDSSSRPENCLLSSTPRRNHFSGVITSGCGDGGYDDEDDRIPIGKLKMKRLSEVIEVSKEPNSPSMHRSSGCNDILDTATHSRNHPVPLRQCEGVKDGAKGTSSGVSSAYILPSVDNNHIFSSGSIVYQMPRSLDTKDAGEDVAHGRRGVDDVGSEIQSVHLSEFVVHRSDVLESYRYTNGASKVEAASVSALHNASSKIRREKSTTRWEYEADMLSSLTKDPELCMEAVCAIYRRQRSLQKSAKRMLPANNRGFNTFDAYKGSRMAEFLMDGDPHGPMKKSVEELQKHNPQGVNYCCKLATHYSEQLFLIYQNKEDPYFSPS